ncbi:50S ribosomal protein L21, mitochondrial [Linum grandiflorum]
MAQRRSLQSLARLISSSSSSAVSAHRSLKPLNSLLPAVSISSSSYNSILPNSDAILSWCGSSSLFSRRYLSSGSQDDEKDDDDDDEEGDEDDETDYSSGDDDDLAEGAGELSDSNSNTNPSAPIDKVARAAEIGYQVVGSLKPFEKVFKPYEPVYAVVQIGSHQFKVSNDDSIFTEKLKYCDINDKLILNKVLLLGSPTETIVGRPIVPNSAVHAVVEEHALDAKVIIFKKKRRKNYRRTKGHRQELTKLRITDIQGIAKPEIVEEPKPTKAKSTTKTVEQKEKVAVAA